MTEQKKEKTTITKQENMTIIQTGQGNIIMRNDGVININIGTKKREQLGDSDETQKSDTGVE